MFKRMKEQKAMIARYKNIFTSEEGQRVLSDMMKVCGMQQSSFDTDPLKMAYHEGQRAVVLRILKTINVTEAQLKVWFEKIEKQQSEIEEEQL